jgi:hypothetical protein
MRQEVEDASNATLPITVMPQCPSERELCPEVLIEQRRRLATINHACVNNSSQREKNQDLPCARTQQYPSGCHHWGPMGRHKRQQRQNERRN